MSPIIFQLIHLIHFVAQGTPTSSLVYVLGALAAGGMGTAIVGYLRLRRQGAVEKEEIISTAAQRAVSVLRSSLDRLDKELREARDARDTLASQQTTTRAEAVALKAQVGGLNDRIQSLERAIIGYKSKERFIEAVLEALDGVFLVNIETGIIEYANPAAHVIFGYADGGLNGRVIESIVPFENRAEHLIHRMAYLKSSLAHRGRSSRHLQGLRQNGEIIPIGVSLTAMENDLVMVVVVPKRD